MMSYADHEIKKKKKKTKKGTSGKKFSLTCTTILNHGFALRIFNINVKLSKVIEIKNH